jgi:hypothetical protein
MYQEYFLMNWNLSLTHLSKFIFKKNGWNEKVEKKLTKQIMSIFKVVNCDRTSLFILLIKLKLNFLINI